MYAPEKIRAQTLKKLKAKGIDIPNTLPTLEPDLTLRPENEIINRALTLSTVTAKAYGFKHATHWLEQNSLIGLLAKSEKDFVLKDKGNPDQFKANVESLYAFAWLLGFYKSIKHFAFCPENLITKFPDLQKGESPARFREAACLQRLERAVEELDFHFCLHWQLREVQLNRRGSRVGLPPYVVVQRRRALEWCLSNNDWDDVILDT